MEQHQAVRHPLAFVRAERRWSLEHLARLLALAAERRGLRYAPGRDRIWKWEHGQTPSDDYQLLLADVLSLDPRLPGRMPWPVWLPAFDTPRPLTPADSRAVLQEALMPDVTPDRRTFLAYTSTALLAVAAAWPAAAPLPLTSRGAADRVDEELVDWLEQRAADLAEVTPQLPAADRLVDAHLHTCLQVIDEGSYRPACGRRLHAIAARLAQTSGWRAFDQGQHATAQRRWHLALHTAQHTDDADLGAGVLADMAYQYTWMRQIGTSTALLGYALEGSGSAAMRCLLHLRTARACATTGDARATTAALAASEQAWERVRGDRTPAAIGWLSLADLRVDAGRCWLDLGNLAKADAAFVEGLEALAPRRQRTRAVFQTAQAESALAAGDVERAVHHIQVAGATARASGAARCVTAVDRQRRRIRRTAPGHEAVAVLA